MSREQKIDLHFQNERDDGGRGGGGEGLEREVMDDAIANSLH